MALKIFQQKSGKILEMLYPGGECMGIHCTTHSSFCNLEYLPNMCKSIPLVRGVIPQMCPSYVQGSNAEHNEPGALIQADGRSDQ